jgi:hypothetical protein
MDGERTAEPRYWIETSWSTESLGRSPSEVAVTVMLFKAMALLWLSRKVVSADVASRGDPYQRLPWRHARRIDHPPSRVDERLGHCVEVHRRQARRPLLGVPVR